MRSTQLNLNNYDTDKIANGYLTWYDPVFEPLIDQPITLLELGIFKGESLKLWRDYFPKSKIIGVDLRPPKGIQFGERIQVYQGSQEDLNFLSNLADQAAPNGFDIIIDDASHNGFLTRKSFWYLFQKHLNAGGFYVIEDWGTGYWGDWPDGVGFNPEPDIFSRIWDHLIEKLPVRLKIHMKIAFKSHNWGMVGFIKQLVDEQGMADISRGSVRGKPNRRSRFESVLITPSIVFVRKAKMMDGEEST